MKRPLDLLFALRGGVLGGLFLLVALARYGSEQPVLPEALVLLGLGAALRLWAGREIGSHSNGLRMEGPVLAVGGPYAFARHPLYLSNILAAAGLLFFANALPAPGAFAILAVVLLHHVLLARAEEERLGALHGEAWRVYREVTPRWLGIPRGTRVAMAGPDRTWSGALRRQGLNLIKPPLAALVLWALSRA
jgi:protein-S-isoprenylcysteine O-methyltransferase Ste14